MKSALLILMLFVSINAKVFSQIPTTFNYQAVVRDANNNLKTNSEINMRISILYSSVDGEVVYSETQNPVTNQFGIVNVEIGGGQQISGIWPIDWQKGDYFLKTEYNLDPDLSGYTISETSQILSVPIAQYSQSSSSLTGNAWETAGIYTGTALSLNSGLDPNFTPEDSVMATIIYLGPNKIAININYAIAYNPNIYWFWAAALGEKNPETGEIPFMKIYRNNYFNEDDNTNYSEMSGTYNENTKEITLKFHGTNNSGWFTWDINLTKIED